MCLCVSNDQSQRPKKEKKIEIIEEQNKSKTAFIGSEQAGWQVQQLLVDVVWLCQCVYIYVFVAVCVCIYTRLESQSMYPDLAHRVSSSRSSLMPLAITGNPNGLHVIWNLEILLQFCNIMCCSLQSEYIGDQPGI